MDARQSHQIVSRVRLTTAEQQAVQALADYINSSEGLDLVLPMGFDEQDSQQHPRFFLVYENQQLSGFAGVQEGQPPEVVGLVHPEQRRRGIATALLEAVTAEYRRRGVERLWLVSDEAAESGRAFLAAAGARFLSAEYRLLLDPALVDRAAAPVGPLHVRPAGAQDLESLVQVQARSFGDAEEEVRELIERSLHDPQRQCLIGELDHQPIGCLRIGRYDGFADVTAFGVLPEMRGRGYGRRMLLSAVQMLLDEGWETVVIEVATDNRNALGLYRSCGFCQATTYGFYELTI